MSKPSQKDRVLLHLVRAGSRGVHQGEWLQHGGADGLGRITRLAARIDELREIGMDIRTEGLRDGFGVYRYYPARVEPAPPQQEAPAPPAAALFELAFDDVCPPPRNAILGEEAA